MEILNHHLISSEIAASSITGRDFEAYQRYFGYTPENLQGKKILDIGSGRSNFSTLARNYGADVIDLDPRPNLDSKSTRVKGVAQYLPFRDEVFDEVISSYGVYWVTTGIREALFEMLRVTRDGGRVMTYPMVVKVGVNWGSVLPKGSELSEDGEYLDPWKRLTITKDNDLYPNTSLQREYVNAIVRAIPSLNSGLVVPDYFEFSDKKSDLSYY